MLHSLSHLQKVWQGVLPQGVYLRCQGTLLNTVMEELILIITSLEVKYVLSLLIKDATINRTFLRMLESS